MKFSEYKNYAENWSRKSECFSNHGIYERLAYILPRGKVLEFGCGSGRGTRQLLRDHAVLSLEKNNYLIAEAKRYLDIKNNHFDIHACNFLELTQIDNNIINEFEPKVITGWFMDSCNKDIVRHTPSDLHLRTKKKLYREKIENAIVALATQTPSVQYIQFVFMFYLFINAETEFILNEIKEDYDDFVFEHGGFSIVNIEETDIPWYHDDENIPYSSDKIRPVIISMIARKKC